jgi:hypothetical protein
MVVHHRGHAAVVVDRSIRYATGLLGTPLPLARYGPNSATAVAPERHRTRWRVGLTRARAHRNLNVPESTILYQATILLRTRVSVDAVETPGPRRGSRSVPGGTTRAPGGTPHGEGRYSMDDSRHRMLPLMSHVDVPRGSSPLERIKLSTHSVSSMSTLPLLGPRQLSEDLKQARGPHASTDAHGDHRRLGSAPLAFDEHVAHLPRARHPNQWQSMAIRGISVAISDPPAESPSCQTGGQSRWRRR